MRIVALLTSVLALAACGRQSAGRTEAPNVELAKPAPENRHNRQIGDVSVVAYCDPSLKMELGILFDVVDQMRAEGVALVAGLRVSAGWTTLVLRAQGDTLVFQEPDYSAKDPEISMRDDITASVKIFGQQIEVLSRTGLGGEEVNFDQHVLLTKGALALDKVYLVRVASPGGRLTGWRIAPTEDQEGEMEVDSIPLYELFVRRPGLVRAMALPVGYMVFFTGDEIDVIVDSEDNPIWERRQEV